MSDTPVRPAEPAGDPAAAENIVQFPSISEEERNRRIMVEVKRLASLAPGEWKLWYKRKANELGIDPDKLAELIQAEIAAREKAAGEKLAQDKLGEQRAERQRKTEAQQWREQARIEDTATRKTKEKSRAFADIIKLPSDQHEAKLDELAKKLDEDDAALRAEFAEYRAAETASSTPEAMSEGDVERWPEPVATAVLLEELILCLSKHVVAKPHQVLVIALWVMLTWVHELAAHYSPYLVMTSPKAGCGKTTLLVDVIRWLVPKPFVGGGYTAASIFRTADREKPTMLFDNVDKLFGRNPDVTDLFLYGWTRGIKVPRVERVAGELTTRLFDPFCAKACTLIGTDLPEALTGRCLLIELWPKKEGEEVPEKPFEQALLDEFKNLQRKLARWSDDNATAMRDSKPTVPPAFINRSADNWRLLWAIADLAGGDWAEQARTAAERLSQAELAGPSWLDRLLEELWVIFVKERANDITSAKLVARLAKDPISVWRDYGRGHSVTQREIAALLRKTLHIHPCLVGRSRLGGYAAKDFFEKEIFERFLGRDPLILSPTRKRTKVKSTRSRAKRKRG